MAMTAQLWTLNGIATELNRDRRAVGKAMSGVEPDGMKGKSKLWLMTTAVAAIFAESTGGNLTEEKARLAKAREYADQGLPEPGGVAV